MITKEGKICDWCGKVIFPYEILTDEDKQWPISKCSECMDKATPIEKSGKIEDLPKDYWPPSAPSFEEYVRMYFGVNDESNKETN